MTADVRRDDLFQQILLSPLSSGADELHILTGYSSANFALFHILEAREHLKLDFTVRLHIGMTGEEGIELAAHQGFVAAERAISGGWLRVSYAPAGVADHSKIYVWLQNGAPTSAWAGSANYTSRAFGISGPRRESMVPTDAESTWSVLQAATEGFVPASSPDVFSRVEVYQVVHRELRERVDQYRPISEADAQGLRRASLPLVQRTKNPGQVHNAGAGLNWGQRGSRRRAEAYIPVPASVSRSGFFPQRGVPFTAHTDDGATLFLTIAQDGDKALHSVPDNADVGLWFRNRLGLADDAFVTTADLDRYGAHEVSFTSLGDDVYFLKF